VLVCFDKFKGALSAPEACELAREVIQRARPSWEVDVAPLSDGGDGFCQILTEAARGTLHPLAASGPIYDERRHADGVLAQVGLVDFQSLPLGVRQRLALGSRVQRLALVEMAAVNGLALVPQPKRDIWRASSYGTGELLLGAAKLGADAVLLGIGGSATSDLGLGALCALGLGFADAAGMPLHPPLPADWPRIDRVLGRVVSGLLPLRIACDVDNPLLGPNGAAAVYGPQKGLRAGELSRFDAEAARVAALLCVHLGVDLALSGAPGAGAAGGVGFALMAAAGASLVPGFELVADWLNLEARLIRADWVITGEGRFDASSLAGKGPGALVARARRAGRRCAVFAGSVAEDQLTVDCELLAISGRDTPLDEAVAGTRANLATAVERWLSHL
jgi:glycerate kinase